MNSGIARKYDNSTRAKEADNREEKILQALAKLWLQHSIHQITLEMVAEEAGISVRTLLRRFGSKEGLFEEATHRDPAGIKAIKDEAQPGDLELAVEVLMREYERTGDAGIRTLAVEAEFPFAAKILAKGRAHHREWCQRIFAPFLPPPAHPDLDIWVGAYYAATDIHAWKLLRRDLGYSLEDTTKIFLITLQSITDKIKASHEFPHRNN